MPASCSRLDTVCYARKHLLTVGGITALLTAVPLLVWWLERRDRIRETLDERRHARDRKVMLARVRHKWIDELLTSSLGEAARLQLGLVRCPDVLTHTGRLVARHGSTAHSPPPRTSITDVFDKLGGALLILGEPGAGKTTALLELASAVLDQAEADERQPIPVVVNLASWTQRRRPLAIWLVDKLHTSYQVPKKVGQAWLAGGELLPHDRPTATARRRPRRDTPHGGRAHTTSCQRRSERPRCGSPGACGCGRSALRC